MAVINRTNPSLASWPERVTLLFEVLGASVAGAEEQLTLLQAIVERVGGRTEEVRLNYRVCSCAVLCVTDL